MWTRNPVVSAENDAVDAMYPNAMCASPEVLPDNGPEGHFSSTRSRSKRGPGRPKLTREQQRESLARKRARNAAWMREARRPKRENLP
jgi:hypothetical protein